MTAMLVQNYALDSQAIEAIGGVLVIPIAQYSNTAGPANVLNWRVNGNGIGLQADEIAGLSYYSLDVPQIKSGTITKVAAVVRGTAAHGGAPGTLPALRLQAFTLGNSTPAYDVTQSDVYGSAGVYEANHLIELVPSFTQTRFSQRIFRLLLGNEFGANAVNPFVFSFIYATVVPELAY